MLAKSRSRMALLAGLLAAVGAFGCASTPPEVELVRRGEEALALGELDEAEDRFEEALVERPGDREASLGMVRAALERGDAEAALAIIDEQGWVPPLGSEELCSALALACTQRLDAENPKVALPLARRHAASQCEAPSGLLARALLAEADRFRSEGQSEEAIALYAEVLESDPQALDAIRGLAQLLIVLDRIDGDDGAVELLSDGLLHHPDDRGLQRLMVAALGIRYPERSSSTGPAREQSKSLPTSEPGPGEREHD